MEFAENFGLELLTEAEEDFMALCRAVCATGKVIMGYHQRPYINREFGWPQFIVRTGPAGEENHLKMTGLDTHMSGETDWKVRIKNQRSRIENEDPLTRRVFVANADDNSGAVMITLVNADVLPSFLPGDEIDVQTVGFPANIHYYENEDAYENDQPVMENGKKMLLADGAVFPMGLFMKEEEKKLEDEGLTLIRGTVKKVQHGIVDFGEEKGWSYWDVIINTQFGDLEIAHTEEQVDETERKHIKVGAVVCGLFYISGDVAIREYTDGCVFDFDHNLALLRYTLQEGAPERLGAALSENAEYVSEWANTTYRGRKEVVERFHLVKENNTDRPFFAHFATITEIKEGEEELPYSVGTRCIIISMDSEDEYDSICFMECDGEGKISKIHVTRNSRYYFRLDEKKEFPDPLEDCEFPKDICDAIRMRACFHGLLDHGTTREEVEERSKRTEYYVSNANAVIMALKEHPPEDVLAFLQKLYGYMLAKAVELQLRGDDAELYPIETFHCVDRIMEEYVPEAAEEWSMLLCAAYGMGQQFYTDFSVHRVALATEEGFEKDLLESLVFVQQIGEEYAKITLGEGRGNG